MFNRTVCKIVPFVDGKSIKFRFYNRQRTFGKMKYCQNAKCNKSSLKMYLHDVLWDEYIFIEAAEYGWIVKNLKHS